MGDLIPLFRPKDEQDQAAQQEHGWALEDVITDEMAESIVEVSADMQNLWTATSEAELMKMFASIKERVDRWPGS